MSMAGARRALRSFREFIERYARAGAEPLQEPWTPARDSSRRSRMLRRASMGLGILALFFSGYFLTYHLFFKDVSLEKLGKARGASAIDFRYDGVAYFHGNSLSPQDEWTVSYYAPWVAKLSDASIEIYVELPAAQAGGPAGAPAGALIVRQSHGNRETRLPIDGRRQQRLHVQWTPRAFAENQVSVRYDAAPGNGHERLHFATRIVDYGVLWLVVLLGVGGCGLIYAGWRARWPQHSAAQVWRRNAVYLSIAAIAYYAHSGAFTSDVFFPPGHGLATSMAVQLGHLGKNGHFSQQNYRDAGLAVVPLLVTAVQADRRALDRSFQEHYPTSRYVLFCAFLMAIAFLGATLWRMYGQALAALFMLLSVLFFPFVVDLYLPDSDAMFVVLFPLLLAFLLRVRYGAGALWPNVAGMLVVFFLIGFTKITPAFLILVAPLAFVLPLTAAWRKSVLLSMSAMVAFAVAFAAGKAATSALQHPERNVGIEGEPFQSHVVWHMLWAAYGTYDSHSAHGFTVLGQLRNERVAEKTGLPIVTYLRQSQTATEKVYRPEVLNALEESPGYFYGTAFYRFYTDGLKFFRYTYGNQDVRRWFTRREPGTVETSSGAVTSLPPEREAIRYDLAWKASPVILLAKLTQLDMTLVMDAILLVVAFAGMATTRYRGLAAVLVLCGLAQLGFDSLVHAVNRYFMFCSVALLIGLALTLERIAGLIAGTRVPRTPG